MRNINVVGCKSMISRAAPAGEPNGRAEPRKAAKSAIS
jgi:hypothetical protein